MAVSLSQVAEYLDEYLRTSEITDYSGAHNGLQVENAGQVTRVVAAVDACVATVSAATDLGADLMLVHHGLFWGAAQPLVGRQYRRIAPLVRSGIAVYSSHLPLDCHPDVGNNAVLAGKLALTGLEPFGDYKGTPVGLSGGFDGTVADLADALEGLLGCAPKAIGDGARPAGRVGVVSGGAGSMIEQAHASGLDTFITGEGNHHTFFDAEELGVSVLYCGHYATETFGVKALAAHIERRFGIPWDFVDHPTGL